MYHRAPYHGINDNVLVGLPQGGLDLDLGPSFMDEVMKALGDPKPASSKNSDSLLDERSPLIETSSPSFGVGRSTFDNVALAREEDLCGSEDHLDTDFKFHEDDRDSAGCLKDSGIVETSFASLEISDYSKLSEDGPMVIKEEEVVVKRRRPTLKLVSPPAFHQVMSLRWVGGSVLGGGALC